MINPIMFSTVDKINCKNAEAKAVHSKHFDLPFAKELQADSFVKNNSVRGPLCGIDCHAI